MQGINVFASTAARDAAITSPQEGQFAYTKDTNSLWYYTGSAWAASGATGDIEGVTAGVGITGGGTSGTVTITNDMATTITAAGDIVVGTGSGTYDNLPIGTTAQVLTADTTVSPYKVKWATPSSGVTFVGASVKRSSTQQTMSNNAYTILSWDNEDYDTDAYWTLSPNPTRVTIPTGKSGKHLLTFTVAVDPSGTGIRIMKLQKNGADVYYGTWADNAGSGAQSVINSSVVLNLTAADYIELFYFQNSGGGLLTGTGAAAANLQITYLGA
jgi:hypothetical protein